MKIRFYIPYDKMKESFGVKTLKACSEIFKNELHPILDECADHVYSLETWDDDGKHRIGRFYSITYQKEGLLDRIVAVVGRIMEDVSFL